MVNRCIVGWKALLGKFDRITMNEKDQQYCPEYDKFQADFIDIFEKIGLKNNERICDLLKEAEVFQLANDNFSGSPSGFDASNQLAKICYCSVRFLKPSIIVETGVSRGVTSAFILKALSLNENGLLYSIDLPYLAQVIHNDIGTYVPDNLKQRWKLLLGAGLRETQKLKKQIKNIDLFIHDSNHSYNNQLAEYRLAWPWIRKGGVLISDDVKNCAFMDFCTENSKDPVVIKQGKESGFIGIVRKC